MQYGSVFGTRSRYARLRSEGLHPSKAFAPMQYRHEIGHAPANFAFATVLSSSLRFSSLSVSTGELRLPLFHAYTAPVTLTY